MDIDYLLLLQNLRASTGDALSPFFAAASKLTAGPVPLLLVMFVYWAFDRAAGKRIIGGFALSLYVNGLLKLIFCVYRPWIRDARVEPYGDSKLTATGYSFPSGHAAWATAPFGGTALWLRRNGRKVIAALLWTFVAVVLFSRNYLGVHTPQDVLVGLGVTLLAMWAIYKMEAWTDADPKRDLYVMVGGVALVAVTAAFFLLKSYPMDYAADGSLIVDPSKMVSDSLQGLGFLAGYVIARYFERRGFDFDRRMPGRSRIVCAIVAEVVLLGWVAACMGPVRGLLGKNAAYLLLFFIAILYGMVVVPAVMGLVAKHVEKAAK